MEIMLIDAKYKGKIVLSKKQLDQLKRMRLTTVALYAAVNFVHRAREVRKQLETSGIKVITSKPARTNAAYQLLGCDVFHGNLRLGEPDKMLDRIDAFVYIGDGMFHPKALLLLQMQEKMAKPVILLNPLREELDVLTAADIHAILGKHRAGLVRFLSATNVGIIVSVKPGQQQLEPGLALVKRYPDKQFYFFADNNIQAASLEDFPFIEAWVNTACPRIGLDDTVHIRQPIVNLNHALRAEDALTNIG